MKKLILAVVILLVIIFSGILSLNLYSKTSRQLSKMVDSTYDFVNSGNWDGATKEVENIEKAWDKIEGVWAVLIDHFEIDNIEMSLKKSKRYIETKDLPLSLAELENLKFMVEHIYEKEKFSLENIF
jgi:peptidoglycan hydrolase CwlO-like protein